LAREEKTDKFNFNVYFASLWVQVVDFMTKFAKRPEQIRFSKVKFENDSVTHTFRTQSKLHSKLKNYRFIKLGRNPASLF